MGDAAGHAFIGQTRRNSPLFRDFGHIYVYLGYGVSWLINISSEDHGVGAGVLFRAGEPVWGVDEMMRRHPARAGWSRAPPGRASSARRWGVDKRQDGGDFFGGGAVLARRRRQGRRAEIGVSVRIGITKDADRPLRFYERGSPFVSGPRGRP